MYIYIWYIILYSTDFVDVVGCENDGLISSFELRLELDMLRLDKTVASPSPIASGLTPYAVDASGFNVKDNAVSYTPWIPAMVIHGRECAFGW